MRSATCCLLACLVFLGCGHAHERRLAQSSHQLGRAIARGKHEQVVATVVPGARAQVDFRELAAHSKAWGAALAKTREIEPAATIMLTAEMPLSVVWTDDGWRLAEDPTDLYGQATPRGALRAFVLATRNKRFDVLVRLAPRRYRIGLSAKDLAEAWTKGPYSEVLQRARDSIAAHLHDPIASDDHEAVLEVERDHVVRLEREGRRWVVSDFLPKSSPVRAGSED